MLNARTLMIVSFWLLVAGFVWISYDTYIWPAARAGERAITNDANDMVQDHATGVKKQLAEIAYSNPDGTVNRESWRQRTFPKAMEVALVRRDRDEGIAIAKGETLPQPVRYLPGSQSAWLATGIPIYGSCVHIHAEGEVSRGVGLKAGPNGLDQSTMTQAELLRYEDSYGDRTTLVPGLPWGTLLGHVCSDNQGRKCGAPYPLGEDAYISAALVGAGRLGIIVNGFVSRSTHASILGFPDVGMSDYNVYKGGFRIDQESAPDYKCEPITQVTTP